MTGSWTNGAQASDGTGKSLASRVCTMPDRVSVSITIGGILPADRVPELIETANRYGLSLEWDGGPLTEIPSGEPLCLRAHEVLGGDIDDMEDFCCHNDLPFRSWSDGNYGHFTPEIRIWIGEGPRQVYTAAQDEKAVLTADEASQLGSYQAIMEHFRQANYIPPPLHILPIKAADDAAEAQPSCE